MVISLEKFLRSYGRGYEKKRELNKEKTLNTLKLEELEMMV
jgi:hypothetical protein